jgi:hypothetical protein
MNKVISSIAYGVAREGCLKHLFLLAMPLQQQSCNSWQSTLPKTFMITLVSTWWHIWMTRLFMG